MIKRISFRSRVWLYGNTYLEKTFTDFTQFKPEIVGGDLIVTDSERDEAWHIPWHNVEAWCEANVTRVVKADPVDIEDAEIISAINKGASTEKVVGRRKK